MVACGAGERDAAQNGHAAGPGLHSEQGTQHAGRILGGEPPKQV